jgi:hypothetical protein
MGDNQNQNNQTGYNPNAYTQNNPNPNAYNQNTYNPGNYNQNYNPYPQQQQPYYNPYQANRPYDPNNEPMKLKDWLITFLLLLIPFANIVLPFVWAFGSDVNKSKKTFFQAALIWAAIITGIYILLFLLFASVFVNFFNDLSYRSY